MKYDNCHFDLGNLFVLRFRNTGAANVNKVVIIKLY